MLTVRGQQMKSVSGRLSEIAHKGHAEHEDRMKIDQRKVLFVSDKGASIEDVEERPPPFANLLPGFPFAEYRMFLKILLEVKGAQQHIGGFAIPIGSDGRSQDCVRIIAS